MIVFANKGLIDLRAIRTFGMNAKVTENPLGFFGTGLKYGLAVLLRAKQQIALYRGLDRYVFTVKQVNSRGKGFDVVSMHGPDDSMELPFTLELGKTWEIWQAYRELHSNALDEQGGTTRLFDRDYTPRADETAIVVEGKEIEAAYATRDTIFLPSVPLFANEYLQVHAGESKHVYYRGVRVFDLQQPSLFTYNLLHAVSGLTEDRTLKSESDLSLRVGSLMCASSDIGYLETTMTAPIGTYEYTLNSYWGETPKDTFCKVYTNLRRAGRVIDLTSFANAAYLRFNKHLPIPDPVELSRVQQRQLDKAVAFCKQLGWPVTDFPIITVAQQRNGLLAWMQDHKLVLTVQVFDQGTKIVAQALIEEYLHAKHGFKDMTREFQTHLFQTIVTMGENLLGEPL